MTATVNCLPTVATIVNRSQPWHRYNRDALINQNYTAQHSLNLTNAACYYNFALFHNLNTLNKSLRCYNSTDNYCKRYRDVSQFLFALYYLHSFRVQTTAWSILHNDNSPQTVICGLFNENNATQLWKIISCVTYKDARLIKLRTRRPCRNISGLIRAWSSGCRTCTWRCAWTGRRESKAAWLCTPSEHRRSSVKAFEAANNCQTPVGPRSIANINSTL